MNELFESNLIRRYPEFYFGLGLWAAALLVVIGAAAGLVPIKRQRTALLMTLITVAAPLLAIALCPSSSFFPIYLVGAAIPSAVVAFASGLVTSRRLRRASSFSTEARGRYRWYFGALALFIASLIGVVIYVFANMTLRF
ncbi:MAG: hypothetical protein ABI488_18575 [Polyangiaceae bacterium]